MTVIDAITQIISSTRYNATKRPSMGGYIKRGEISTTTGTEGDFTLTFVNRAGTEYNFTYDASASDGAKWGAPGGNSPTFPLSGELFEEMLADDWAVGTAATFETARNPGSNDKW